MTHGDFVKQVLTLLEGVMAQEHLRLVESSEQRMFSTVSVGNEHAGLRFSVEWRALFLEVNAYRCVNGQPPPPSVPGTSPFWLSLKELIEVFRIHPLETPELTASARSEEGIPQVTPKDLMAYLTDLAPLLKRVCGPWLRGNFVSFDEGVRLRDALIAEPELGSQEAVRFSLAEGAAACAKAPLFVEGVVEAWAPLSRAGWHDVWYAMTPHKLAMALTRGEVGVEVRLHEPRPPEPQVELILLEAGKPPAYDQRDRRVAIRWALEAKGLAAPTIERGAGVGLYAFLGEVISALTRASPEFLVGDVSVLREAQAHRQQLEESVGAEFR